MSKKLAFLFLIYDSIHQEELWNKFFKGVNPDKYSIYVHYKDNKPLEFFEQYKLENCIPTEWAQKSLVLAHNLLLEEALKDEQNTNFILV